MVIRVEDLIETILRQREEFLSISNDGIDVITVKSSHLYEDLLFIMENVPDALIHRIGISDDSIYITIEEVSVNDLDVDIHYCREKRSFSVEIPSEQLHRRYNYVDTVDEFIKYLNSKDIDIVLKSHPYGIIVEKGFLHCSDVMLSMVYPVPIDFDDLQDQYFYMYKREILKESIHEFSIRNLYTNYIKTWKIPCDDR